MLKYSLSKVFHVLYRNGKRAKHFYMPVAHANVLSVSDLPFKQICFCVICRGIRLHSHRYGKLFHESENEYAHKVMETFEYKTLVHISNEVSNRTTFTNITKLEDIDWTSTTPTELCNYFCQIAIFSMQCKLPITEHVFDTFINALEEKIQYFSDSELSATFNGLRLFPETDKVDSKNFFKIWTALDRACVSRLHKWNYNQILFYADYTYMLRIARLCEYTTQCVDLLSFNSSKLSCQQLVQTYFYIGLLRKSPKYVSNLEWKVKQSLHQIKLDELAIISLGLFKSKSRIQDLDLLRLIIEVIIKDCPNINEISLASLLKLIRYSFRSSDKNIINGLFNALEKEINRLSVMCCVQIALLGLSTQVYHKESLDKIAIKVIVNISEARLKDIERLILVFVSLGYKPLQPNEFFFKLIQELSNPQRNLEISRYGKSYVRCISYLTMCNLYPMELINKVLDSKFIERVYGNNVKDIDRSLFVIDKAVEIGSCSYKGNRLSSELSNKLAYALTEKTSNECDHTISSTASFKVMAEVIKIMKRMRGSSFVINTYVLPQYQKADVIFSNNVRGEPRKLNLRWFDDQFGSIIWAPDKMNRWYALNVLGGQAYIYNTKHIHGQILTKCEQLKAIGYIPILVSWRVWSKLKNDEQKANYLQKLIYG